MSQYKERIIDDGPMKPAINFYEEEQHFDELNLECSQNQWKQENNNNSVVLNYLNENQSSQIIQGQLGFANNVWKKRALRIVYHISKFLLSLQQNTDTMRFRLMQKNVMNAINDQGADYDFYFFRKMIKAKPTMVQQLLRTTTTFMLQYTPEIVFKMHIKVLEPDETFKIIWDICVVIVVVSNIFYIPFKIAFTPGYNDFLAYAFETIPSLVLILEIFFNFNTAFYDKGLIITNRKSISLNYLQERFLLDLLIVIPFMISQSNIPYLDAFLILRIRRVKALVNNIEEVLNLRQNFAMLIDLAKLIFILLFVGHFCACFWFYLGTFEGTISWITKYRLDQEDVISQYVNSLYWSTITVLTVGYGDIVPQTILEKTLVIVMSLITCGVFGYSINSIGQIVKDMEAKREKLKSKLSKIQHYLTRQKITKSLKLKVLKYFEYLLHIQEEEDAEVRLMMQQLKPELKTKLMVETYLQVLKSSKYIRENVSERCLNQLCSIAKEHKYSPGDVIFNKAELSNRVFFLKTGKVSIVFEQSRVDEFVETRIRKIEAGYVIGEKNFLLNHAMPYQAKCLSFVSVIFLEYQDFLEVLKQFPEDYERYCFLRDDLLFNNGYKRVVSVCEICGSNHSFLACPLCFYQAKSWKIIQNLIANVNQKRKYFHRKKEKTKVNNFVD